MIAWSLHRSYTLVPAEFVKSAGNHAQRSTKQSWRKREKGSRKLSQWNDKVRGNATNIRCPSLSLSLSLPAFRRRFPSLFPVIPKRIASRRHVSRSAQMFYALKRGKWNVERSATGKSRVALIHRFFHVFPLFSLQRRRISATFSATVTTRQSFPLVFPSPALPHLYNNTQPIGKDD